MTTFAQAASNQTTTTTNGMTTRITSASSCADLFFKIGASRGQNIIPQFAAAFAENQELATRIALWARDVRGGAGERQLFRDILTYLESYPLILERVIPMIPELGRWDDLLVFKVPANKIHAYTLIKNALNVGNGLCAKWMPRQGQIAVELRNFLGMSPKQYRKTLVHLTKVVESQMCANDWDNINFSHVPSLAAARYRNAFNRHTTKYRDYVNALTKGDPSVKVNAAAVYPYDVIKANSYYDTTEQNFVIQQWNALPNFVGDANILPLVDVSGSMSCLVTKTLSCMDVAVSLGLYLSEKNTGKFKDMFLTFSAVPQLLTLKGNICERQQQMVRSEWGMNTNLNAAMNKILKVAIDGNVPQEEMPQMLLILSDMQFDQSCRFDESAMEMIRRKYEAAGYTVPVIVFWNLHAHDNVPVKFDESGVALISGFSPSILKSVLNCDITNVSPESIMLETIMNSRYNF